MSNSFPKISTNHTLDDEEIKAIVKIGTRRYCEPGDLIFQLGSNGYEMYILVSGEVELIFEGGKEKKHLQQGDFFGELAFVMGEHQRTATAKVTRKTELAVLDKKTVSNLTENNSKLLFSLLRRTCMYLFKSEQSLIHNLKQKNIQLQKTLDFLRVTKEELDYQELLAQTDQLTGLYNRRCFDSQLKNFINRTQGSNNKLGLLMIDLDKFKPVNDTYGHQCGDEVLVRVSDILKTSCRPTDLPCRLGGDEFALLLPNFDTAAGQKIGEKIRSRVYDLPPVIKDAKLKVTVSIGGTICKSGESPESFVERADKNLYKAKHEGRNIVVWE